jgi:hypothetical protein
MMAVAHSLRVRIYYMLRDQVSYQELGPDFFDQLPRFRPKKPLFDFSPRRPRCDCWPAAGESHSTRREP